MQIVDTNAQIESSFRISMLEASDAFKSYTTKSLVAFQFQPHACQNVTRHSQLRRFI